MAAKSFWFSATAIVKIRQAEAAIARPRCRPETACRRPEGPSPGLMKQARRNRNAAMRWPLLLIGIFLLQGRMEAQHEHHSSQLPVLVDGARTPEAIPDGLAYTHFLAAIALEAGAPEEARKRQAAQLLPLGLEPEHQEALKRILAHLKAGLNETERGLQEASRGVQTLEASQRIAALLARRAQLPAAAVEEIRRALPEEALALIEEHVRTHVKRRIVIYGTKP